MLPHIITGAIHKSPALHKFMVVFNYWFSIFSLVSCVHLQVIKALSGSPWPRIAIPYPFLINATLCWHHRLFHGPRLSFVPEKHSQWTPSPLTPPLSAFHPPIPDLIHFIHFLSSRPVFLYPVWLSCNSLIFLLLCIHVDLFFFPCIFIAWWHLSPLGTESFIHFASFPPCWSSLNVTFISPWFCCNLTFHYYSYQQSVIYRVVKWDKLLLT